jgi:hypothetical protein
MDDRSISRHDQRVLELSRQVAPRADQRPAITGFSDQAALRRYERFDGNDHPFPKHALLGRIVVPRDVFRFFMERPSDTMTGEILDDSEPMALCGLLYGCADTVERSTGSYDSALLSAVRAAWHRRIFVAVDGGSTVVPPVSAK